MRTIAKLGMGLCLIAAFSFALTMYRGQLMDASCYNQNHATAGEKVWVQCAPTAATTAFAIHANGNIRMLDDAGNNKAMAAFKDGALKTDRNGDMPVTIDGYRHGNTIKVEGIRARGSNVSVH
jgi:hypothetical protein